MPALDNFINARLLGADRGALLRAALVDTDRATAPQPGTQQVAARARGIVVSHHVWTHVGR
jgi:hypothetical protein